MIVMEMPRVLRKKASEYVAAFEPSLTIESGIIKRHWRTNIEEKVANLDYEQRSVFYQCVLEGLIVLQERVINDKPINEHSLDEIELQILLTQKLLKNSSHESGSDSGTRKSIVRYPKSLEEKQGIARSYIEFLGGVNPKGEAIMSPKEYRNLIEYTNYLIQYEEVPIGAERIRPTNISKDHIKHTYYLIHKELYGIKPVRDEFIHFLQGIFQAFETKPVFSTIKSKFSDSPKSYVADVKRYKS